MYIECLESIEHGNKGDEEVPRPFHQIRTLIDVVGYVSPCLTTHVSVIFFIWNSVCVCNIFKLSYSSNTCSIVGEES
jgi:hypothetical protein